MISKQHWTSSTGTKGNIWRTGLGQNIAMAIYHHPDSWDAFMQSLAQNINILVKIKDFPANFTYTWLLPVALMTWMWLLWAGQRGSWQRHNDGQRWKELKVKRCISHFGFYNINGTIKISVFMYEFCILQLDRYHDVLLYSCLPIYRLSQNHCIVIVIAWATYRVLYRIVS